MQVSKLLRCLRGCYAGEQRNAKEKPWARRRLEVFSEQENSQHLFGLFVALFAIARRLLMIVAPAAFKDRNYSTQRVLE